MLCLGIKSVPNSPATLCMRLRHHLQHLHMCAATRPLIAYIGLRWCHTTRVLRSVSNLLLRGSMRCMRLAAARFSLLVQSGGLAAQELFEQLVYHDHPGAGECAKRN